MEIDRQKLLESLDAEELCKYCSYNSECVGMACYGGEPSFPPCSDGVSESFIDLDSYIDDLGDDINDIL